MAINRGQWDSLAYKLDDWYKQAINTFNQDMGEFYQIFSAREAMYKAWGYVYLSQNWLVTYPAK